MSTSGASESPQHPGKVLWSVVGAVAAAFVATITFIYSDSFQQNVCHWGVVVRVQDRFPGGVRWACAKPASWTPTPGEIRESIDDYLASASFDPVAAKKQFFTAAAITDQKGLAPSGATLTPIIWAQRIGEIQDRDRGYATFTYEWWQASGREPSEGLHRVRVVRVGLIFEDNQQARFAFWGTEGFAADSTGERIDDGLVQFPRGFTEREVTFKTLPDQRARSKTKAKVEDTVRVICRVEAADRDWVRTTDGFLPSDAVRIPRSSPSQLARCEPQHAERAVARYGPGLPLPSPSPS
jgi:hypothetical protein